MTEYRWQRRTFSQRLLTFITYLAGVAVLVWAVKDLDIYWPWVWDAPVQIGDLFKRMSPPKLASWREIGAALVETIHIATLATMFALLLSIPTAYIAAQNTTPNKVFLWLGRFIVVSTRTVNTIIWALLFVAIFGPGALAGVFAIAFRSIGFLGKLMAEAIEEIDVRQVEAVQATGAGPLKVVVYGIVPQVLPAFLAVSILRWDINVRESTVLGLVGAGGIGLILQSSIDLFDWQTVATILIAILGIVIIGELVSGALRRRVI